jgi:hypothetical protein
MDSTPNPAIAPSSVNTAELNAAINLRLALLELPLAADAMMARRLRNLMAPILARQRELEPSTFR